MTDHGYRVGECRACGSRFRRVPDDAGACNECRGWKLCRGCEQPIPLLEYQSHTTTEGRVRYASRCRECLRERRTKFPDRASIYAAYALATGEVALLEDVEPLFRIERLRVSRVTPARTRPAKAERAPYDVLRSTLSERRATTVGIALIEVSRVERTDLDHYLETGTVRVLAPEAEGVEYDAD